MNEPSPEQFSSDPAVAADAPTPEQAAILQYLGLAPGGPMTQAQTRAFLAQAEADPANQAKLRAWHREKYRLHPDLFALPPRSYREARWWRSLISPDTLYGYSFQEPSLDQTFVILAALDRQEPGWDQESGKRREARFMNELATLSPELCKPGCVFPHELPPEDAPGGPGAAPAVRRPSAPSAPSLPDQYASRPEPFTPPSKPAWDPPVQPPTPPRPLRETAASPVRGGGWKWALLVMLAAGTGAYFTFFFRPPTLEHGGRATPSGAADNPASTTLAAKESRQRAIAKYPELARADSLLNARFVVAYNRLAAGHDPLLQQPDWPERLADQCADVPASPATALPSSPSTATVPTPAPTANAKPPAVAAVTPRASPAPSATPLPVDAMFVTLEASYKDRLNVTKYHQGGGFQGAGIAVDVHSMMRQNAKFVVRCVFFKRPTGRGDLRVVLSQSQKNIELTAGQTYSDAFESPLVYRGPGATEEFDGWLVQLLPEGSDKFLKQIGSTGTIEELGKRMKF